MKDIKIKLSEIPRNDLIWAIEDTKYKTKSGDFSTHNRSDDEKLNECRRGMLGQDIVIRWLINRYPFLRENKNAKEPELIDVRDNSWYDVKLITRRYPPQPNYNCPNCKANIDKDHKLFPSVIYLFGTLLVPKSVKSLTEWTRKVFEDLRIDLLKKCTIILSGQISHQKFWKIKREIKEGEDLNEGKGFIILSFYDAYKCDIQDLEPITKIGGF